MSDLFKWDLLGASYTDLIVECETIFENLKVTPVQAKKIECLTRDQSRSKNWYRYRAGRVTASKFKAAACTNLAQPSLSLIKTICYPECHKFHTQATEWGCEHEKTAREAYLRKEKDFHLNLVRSESGLVVHPQYSYLGASPDGCINCECCGRGVLEIKCPFSCRTQTFLQASSKFSFCLYTTPDGYFCLDEKYEIITKFNFK